MPAPYDTFFRTATGGNDPYDYQRRLACGEPSQISDLASALRERPAPCTSRLISIHTVPGQSLDLEPARLGLSPRTGASWSERTGRLPVSHGPFQFAYLEALLRSADARASRALPADSLPLADAAPAP